MKETIIWHECWLNNLKHSRNSLHQKIITLQNHLQNQLEICDREISFSEYQINEAKKEGLKRFDSTLYRVKK